MPWNNLAQDDMMRHMLSPLQQNQIKRMLQYRAHFVGEIADTLKLPVDEVHRYVTQYYRTIEPDFRPLEGPQLRPKLTRHTTFERRAFEL